MRAYGQPRGQLFHNRWPLNNPNRTYSLMNKHKVKHHRNSDSKVGNRGIRTTALEQSVINYWVLKLVLRWHPHIIAVTCLLYSNLVHQDFLLYQTQFVIYFFPNSNLYITTTVPCSKDSTRIFPAKLKMDYENTQ